MGIGLGCSSSVVHSELHSDCSSAFALGFPWERWTDFDLASAWELGMVDLSGCVSDFLSETPMAIVWG